jgi:tetratricopeptide (TPR) repeat protein
MTLRSLFLLGATAVLVFVTPAYAAPLDDANAAFANRGDKASLEKAISLYEQALAAAAPEAQRDILIQLARANYFLSDAHYRGDKEKQKVYYKKAYDLSMKCLNANAAFKTKAEDDIEDAAALISKDDSPCAYWAATGLGKWSKLEGLTKQLSHKTEIKALIGQVLKVNKDYFYGGPDRYFGTYYAVLPGIMGRDLKKSQKHYEASLKIAPFYLGTKVLWAENLSTANDNKEEYVKLLNEVVNADISANPEVKPENENEKAKAKELLAETDKRF